jgi:hypothetical protein
LELLNLIKSRVSCRPKIPPMWKLLKKYRKKLLPKFQRLASKKKVHLKLGKIQLLQKLQHQKCNIKKQNRCLNLSKWVKLQLDISLTTTIRKLLKCIFIQWQYFLFKIVNWWRMEIYLIQIITRNDLIILCRINFLLPQTAYFRSTCINSI